MATMTKTQRRRRVHLPQLAQNPAWADEILSKVYDTVADGGWLPPEWLPRLSDLHRSGGEVTGRFYEYGCGVYGCVYPTMDANVVLKITTDESECDFAINHSTKLPEPICTRYYKAFNTGRVRQEREVQLLWRESAYDIGMIADEADALWKSGDQVADLMNRQWDAAQKIIKLAWADKPYEDEADAWVVLLFEMMEQDFAPSLRSLGQGMWLAYSNCGIIFGDVKMDNVGMVDRPGGEAWVITDPGNVIIESAHTEH